MSCRGRLEALVPGRELPDVHPTSWEFAVVMERAVSRGLAFLMSVSAGGASRLSPCQIDGRHTPTDVHYVPQDLVQQTGDDPLILH
jgi:hypothetical protein